MFFLSNFLFSAEITFSYLPAWTRFPSMVPGIRGLPLITYAPRGRGVGSSLLYLSIAYYMQKGGVGGGPESM